MASTSLSWRALILKPDHLAFFLPGFIGRLPLAMRRRLLISVVWIGIWMIPTALAESMTAMIVCVLFAGIGISPWAISGSSLIERGVPSTSLTEGFSWFSAAVATGAAFGAMLGGIAIDQWGSDGGQVIGIIGGVMAVGVAVAGQGRLARIEVAPPVDRFIPQKVD